MKCNNQDKLCLPSNIICSGVFPVPPAMLAHVRSVKGKTSTWKKITREGDEDDDAQSKQTETHRHTQMWGWGSTTVAPGQGRRQQQLLIKSGWMNSYS